MSENLLKQGLYHRFFDFATARLVNSQMGLSDIKSKALEYENV